MAKFEIRYEFEIDFEGWQSDNQCILTLEKRIKELDFTSHILVFHEAKRVPQQTNIVVFFTNDQNMQRLNRQWRGKDKPTNVLSFPNYHNGMEEEEDFEWGNIALGYETIKQEAELSGISFVDHATHLLIHGVLHLIGFDHEEEEEASDMEQREYDLLHQLGLHNPYEITD